MEVNFATTTLPTIALWGLGLLIFFIGSLLGYFNMNIDAKKKSEGFENKLQSIRAEAERKISEANKKLEEAQSLETNSKAAPAVESPSLLRLKNDDGHRAQIEVDGQPLAAPLTPEKRKRLIELIGYIRPWLEDGVSESQPIASKPISSKPQATVPPRPKPTTPPPTVSPTVKPVPAVLTLNTTKPKTDPELEFKLLSMVQQIDRVLQSRLAGTPLEELGVQLRDTLQGGLEVQIGTQVFESIDDVPDANVKAAIRAAIAEWEQKYIPGA